MVCHRLRNAFSAYLEGELASQARLQVERHIAACPACARKLQEWRQARRALSGLPELAPPADLAAKVAARLRVPAADSITCATAEALLQARLDRKLTPLQAARLDYHLAGCLFCRQEAEAMARIARGLASLPTLPSPSRISLSKVVARATEGRPAPFLFPRPRLALAGALVAAALGALFLPGLLSTTPHRPPLSPVGIATPAAPVESRNEPAEAARAIASAPPVSARVVRAVAHGERATPVTVAFATARPTGARMESLPRPVEPAYDAEEAEQALRFASERERAIEAEIRLARLPEGLAPASFDRRGEPARLVSSSSDPSEAWRERLAGAARRAQPSLTERDSAF